MSSSTDLLLKAMLPNDIEDNAANDAGGSALMRPLFRHRRQHAFCAGIDVPVLKITASARLLQRCAAHAPTHAYTHAYTHVRTHVYTHGYAHVYTHIDAFQSWWNCC